jgi:tripartite-type tricarboxylate transporter receptor subunit TctC
MARSRLAEVLRAQPDGHTLMLGAGTPLSMVPVVRATPPYDPVTTFTADQASSHRGVLRDDAPQRAGRDAAAAGRVRAREPRQARIRLSSSGFTLAATSFFMHQEKLQMLHVPYKGEAPALPDFLSGRVQDMFATPSLGLSHVKEGKLRALRRPHATAQLAAAGSADDGGARATRRAGHVVVAFFGPANLPAEIVERLGREINAILARPAVREDGERRGLSCAVHRPPNCASTSRRSSSCGAASSAKADPEVLTSIPTRSSLAAWRRCRRSRG